MDPRGLDNPTSLDTFSTDLHPDHLFIMEDPYRLEIRLPNPFSPIVGMAYIVAGGRAFSTNRTFF